MATSERTTPGSGRRPTEAHLLEWMQSLSNWGRWGADDQAGTLNLLSPEKALRALALTREGTTVSCARIINYQPALDSPRPPQYYVVSSGDQYRPGEGPDRQVAMDFFGLIFHGHTITHIDSLAHFFWDGMMYNGVPSAKMSVRDGALSHHVDVAKSGIITRGLLVDAARQRGVEKIERGDGVGLDDVEGFERETGLRVEEGDVLLLRTGQLGHRERTGPVDPATAGSAGPLPELLPLLRERGVAVLGSDTGNDVQPSGYARFSDPVHQIGIVALGLWILDNAWLDDLAEACAARGRYEFALSILPLRIPNATGSPVNPVAIF
ncbi:MAG: cyclase family protein [Chloroflexi bacterium]|nr:cyclase family protein [Chloroflexota bacterium]